MYWCIWSIWDILDMIRMRRQHLSQMKKYARSWQQQQGAIPRTSVYHWEIIIKILQIKLFWAAERTKIQWNTISQQFKTEREKTRLQWNLLRLTGSNGRGRRRKVLILSQCGWQIWTFRLYIRSRKRLLREQNILPMVTFLQEKNILTLSSSGIRPEMA